MKRIRLDIGTLTASAREGGSFMFFLYRSGMDKCLPVPLTSSDMHAVLTNFKRSPEDNISIQNVLAVTLREYRIELLEVAVVRNNEQENFKAELLFFDGEKEFVVTVNFADGIILARIFTCPIYISTELMEKYAIDIDAYAETALRTEEHLQQLKESLQEAIGKEDYEAAAHISKEIERLTKK